MYFKWFIFSMARTTHLFDFDFKTKRGSGAILKKREERRVIQKNVYFQFGRSIGTQDLSLPTHPFFIFIKKKKPIESCVQKGIFMGFLISQTFSLKMRKGRKVGKKVILLILKKNLMRGKRKILYANRMSSSPDLKNLPHSILLKSNGQPIALLHFFI